MVHFSTCSDTCYDLMENPKTIANCAELFQVGINRKGALVCCCSAGHTLSPGCACSHLQVDHCMWVCAGMSGLSPQVCVLSPLLFSLSNHSCTSRHWSIKSLRMADDTTLIGLISGGNELAYRSETDSLVIGCSDNNLELNAVRTVEIIVNFRLKPVTLDPNTVEFFHFLGTFINASSPWSLLS